MRLTVGAAGLASLVGLAQATATTYSEISCFTAQGTSKVKSVPTATQAITISLPATARVTTTPVQTIIPSTSTSTSTAFSTTTLTTTLTQVTDTFTSTTTLFETSTASSTVISSSTTTAYATITVTGTSTIPASAGFTPLASELAASGNTASKKRKRADGVTFSKPRDNALELAARAAKASCTIKFGPTPSVSPPMYPQKVTCKGFVEVVTTKTSTVTASTTKQTTLAAPTTIVTSTSVVSLTSTASVADASTTTTVSTISTISTTTTLTSSTLITTTVSNTVTQATATAYAACQANNLVTYVNGNPIVEISPLNSYNTVVTDSAYDCCVACIQAGSACGGSAFAPAQDNTCFLIGTSGGNTCSGSTSIGSFYTGSSSDHAVLSNSNCGQWAYAGA